MKVKQLFCAALGFAVVPASAMYNNWGVTPRYHYYETTKFSSEQEQSILDPIEHAFFHRTPLGDPIGMLENMYRGYHGFGSSKALGLMSASMPGSWGGADLFSFPGTKAERRSKERVKEFWENSRLENISVTRLPGPVYQAFGVASAGILLDPNRCKVWFAAPYNVQSANAGKNEWRFEGRKKEDKAAEQEADHEEIQEGTSYVLHPSHLSSIFTHLFHLHTTHAHLLRIFYAERRGNHPRDASWEEMNAASQ